MRGFIFLSFILLITSATEFDRQIERLENSPFGKTLLQTIFMQLQTEDPLANLIQMMQNLDAQLEAEQRRDDERQERIQFTCESDLSDVQKIIGQAQTISVTLKSELDQLNPQKTAAVANLNRKNAELQDLRKELQEQTERRERENQEHLQILDDLEGALFGVNSVKTYFNTYLDKLEKDRRQFDRAPPQEGSFLQKNRRFKDEDTDDEEYSVREEIRGSLNFAQISNKINKIKHSVKLEGYKALVQVLGQMTSHMAQVKNEASDAEILTKKVLVVLKQIEGFIQAQRLAEEQAEQARASAFEELNQIYNQQIIEANSERVQMEGTLELLTNKITLASNEKFEADVKITVKVQEKNDREADCLTSKQEYDTETAKRNDQKQALTLALDLITSKLGQLKKELLEKGGF